MDLGWFNSVVSGWLVWPQRWTLMMQK